jgi:hypothetical protein
LFGKYPYLLPNLVCTAVIALGLVVGLLFLEETHEDKRGRIDPGLKAGRWVVNNLTFWRSKDSGFKGGYLEIVDDENEKSKFDLSKFNSTGPSSSHAPIAIAPPSPIVAAEISDAEGRPRLSISWRQGFTKQVKLIILSYGILAL